MTIVDAVRRGELAGLEAMRDKLAADMDAAEPSFVAQIAARLQAVLQRIAELSDDSEESIADVLDARRAKRSADADKPARPRTAKRSR